MPWGKLSVAVIVLVLIAVSAHLLLNRDRTVRQQGFNEQTSTSAVDESAPADKTSKSGDASGTPNEFSKLEGRWRRTDAEQYEIELSDIAADGSATASYHNPRPISVSAAKAAEKDGVASVFIELRDVGYPGCTYNLSYDAEQDRLQGIYFQAAQRQEYPVEFVRQ